MNILQQIWTYSNDFLNFFVNLVHAVAFVPVIDHDMVTVGETACVQFCAHLTSELKASCELCLVTLTIYTRRYASLLIIRIFF